MKSNLLIYIEFMLFGGAEQYLLYFIEALHEDYNVFLAGAGDGLFAKYFKKNPYIKKIFYSPILFQPVSRENQRMQDFEEFSAWIERIIDETLPRTFITNNGGYPWNLSCLVALHISYKKGIKNRILIPHSTPDNIYNYGGVDVDQLVSASATAIIFGGKKLMELYQLREHLDSTLFKVCHYGVPDIKIGESSWRPQREHIVVGFLGSMRNLRKGQMQLLQAAILTKSENVMYYFAGNGEKMRELQAFKHENTLNNVQFLGHLDGDDKCRFFSELDIFVLVSEQEGLSLALLEALSSGCAIIATNVGGLSEAVYNGVNGFLINRVSGEILADLIKKIQACPSLLKAYAHNSRKIYEEKFHYQRFLRRIKRTITDLDRNQITGQSFYLPFVKKQENQVSLNGDKALFFIEKGPLPILIGRTLEIEFSSKCQLNCTICPRTHVKKSRAFGHMDHKTFNNILAKFIDQYIECIYVCGIGEATMHPEWIEMCQQLKIKSEAKLVLCTNGTVLPSSNDVIKSNIDRLEISIHTFDGNKHSQGECFNRAIDIIDKIAKLRKECSNKGTHIEISLGIVKHTYSRPYIKALQDFSSANGVDCVSWDLWNRAGTINNEKNVTNRARHINKSPSMCSEYGQSIFIDWRGSVLSCCCDVKSQNIDGSVLLDTIESIRLHKAHKLSLGKPLFAICNVCDSPKTNQTFQKTNYFALYEEIMK